MGFKLLFILVFVVVFLSACGGGGSDDENSPPSTTNKLPVISAEGNIEVDENAVVTVSISASDPDGSISSYAWSQTSGSTVELQNTSSDSISFTAPEVTTQEVLEFEIIVTDNDGGESTSTISVTVNNVNIVPTVNAGEDITSNEQEVVTLSATAADQDGSIISISWEQVNGPQVELENSSTLSSTFIAPDIDQDEALSFEVTVTDNDGDTATDVITVNLLRVNEIPLITDFTAPLYSIEGEEIVLSVEANDPDGEIAAYQWILINDDVELTITNPSSQQVSFTAPQVDSKTIVSFEVTVTDNDGAAVTQTVSTELIPVSSDIARPSQAKIVSITTLSSESVTIDWMNSSDDLTPDSYMQYEVHISLEASFTPDDSTLVVTYTNEFSHQAEDLAAGTQYFVKVVALDLNDNFSWSKEQSFSTPTVDSLAAVMPTDLTELSSISVNENTFTVDSDELTELTVDDFVVSTEGEGFLGKVKEIQENNGVTTVEFEAAALNEVYEDLSLRFSLSLEDISDNSTDSIDSTTLRKTSNAKHHSLRWKESGLVLRQEIGDSDQFGGRNAIANTFSLKAISQNTLQSGVSNDEKSVSDRALRLQTVDSVVVEPGDSVYFDVIGDIISGFSGYEVTELIFNKLDGPKIHEASDDNYGAEFNIKSLEADERIGEFYWQTDSSHYDHDNNDPYVAIFTAGALDTNCDCDKLSLEIRVPIYVGYFEDFPQGETRDTFTSTETTLTVTADAGVEFVPELVFSADIDGFIVQNAIATVGGDLTLDASVNLNATASAVASAEKQLINKSFLKVLVAGGVPIVVSGEFTITGIVEGEAKAELDITNSLNITIPIEAGLTYNDGTWETIGSAQPVLTYTLIGEADGEASATVRLIPELTMKVYETVAATINIEPSLFAELGLEGRFDYLLTQSPDYDINDIDAQYRFTKLDAGGALDLNMRAGLEALGKGIVGYPSADLDELATVKVIEKTTIFGLPTLSVTPSDLTIPFPDSTAFAVEGAARNIPNPFKDDGSSLNPFLEQSGRWEVFPDPGDATFTQIQSGSSNITAFSYSTPAEYRLRFVGNSKIGSFVRQYEELVFDASDYDGNGMPDVWEQAWGIDNPNADDDSDGLTNLEEFQYKTFPTLSDSDGDGVSDGDEVASGDNPIDWNEDEQSSLIAYYPFNENADDASGFGHDGVVEGDIIFENGYAEFDGSSYIRVNNFNFDINDFTISMMVNASDLPSWYRSAIAIHSGETGYINGGDKGTYITLNSNGTLNGRFSTENGAVPSQNQCETDCILPNTWYHVAFVRDASENALYLYINGELNEFEAVDDRYSDYGSLNIVNGLLEIGAPNFWGDDGGWSSNGRQDAKWKGKLDELRVYNQALNADEIKALSQSNGLVAYYPFNENAEDASGFGHDGVVDGDIIFENGVANFDGTSFIEIPTTEALQVKNYTISLWFNSIQSGKVALLSSLYRNDSDQGGGYQVNFERRADLDRLLEIEHLTADSDNWGAATSDDLRDGSWHHMAAVYDGVTVFLYVDGVLADSYSADTERTRIGDVNWPLPVPNHLIGKNSHNGRSGYTLYQGQLDELRIYDTALAESEIVGLFEKDRHLMSVDSELIAYYPFDEDANDYSGNDLHATGHGDVSFSTGIKGNAVDLDGSGDYLATSTITEDWNSWSFSVWVNPRDFDTSANAYTIVEREIIGSYKDFELLLVGSRGTVVLENDSSSDLESISMPENETWTHIVVTYDGETKALYINGELEDSVEESNSQITVDRPLEIGRHANTSYRNYFNGLIDELRIYKVAISEQDVQTLYQDRD